MNTPAFRILIVDAKSQNAHLLRGMLNAIGAADVVVSEDSEAALGLMRSQYFDAVFCDESARPVNPVTFAKRVRRDDRMLNPEIPLIMIAGAARARQVELTRDCGANDLIVRPLSVKTLKRKLKTVLLTPGTFVKSEAFLGPDRRRRLERRSRGADAEVMGDRRVEHSRRQGDQPARSN